MVWELGLGLGVNLDLQSQESYGHDPNSQRSPDSKVRVETDGQMEVIALHPVLTWSIINIIFNKYLFLQHAGET